MHPGLTCTCAVPGGGPGAAVLEPVALWQATGTLDGLVDLDYVMAAWLKKWLQKEAWTRLALCSCAPHAAHCLRLHAAHCVRLLIGAPKDLWSSLSHEAHAVMCSYVQLLKGTMQHCTASSTVGIFCMIAHVVFLPARMILKPTAYDSQTHCGPRILLLKAISCMLCGCSGCRDQGLQKSCLH